MANLKNKIATTLMALGTVGMLYGGFSILTDTPQRDLRRYGYEVYRESDFFAGSWMAKRKPVFGGGYEYLGSLTDDERKEYFWDEAVPLISALIGMGIMLPFGAILYREEEVLD